jgi:GNAT superfamily N-acetyltransferase
MPWTEQPMFTANKIRRSAISAAVGCAGACSPHLRGRPDWRDRRPGDRWSSGGTSPDRLHHQYLAILAVRPGCQGRGIGTALLNARHRDLDRDGVPAYLEASSPRARDLYLRHGYTLRPGGPFRLPEGGPPMWPMWREPAPATACIGS